MENKVKVAFCVPNMIIGGVETVFFNTINELAKNPKLDVIIITHAQIREPLYANWLKSYPKKSVYVYYPLCNWFEDLAPKCRGILKPIRKIIFSLYKKYRRMLGRTKLGDVDVFIDYKNLEFFKELRFVKQPKIVWLHSALSYFESRDKIDKLSMYDKFVAITDEFVDDFKQKYPNYADRIVRIYNPININDIRGKAQTQDIPNGQYFCHVSRLSKGKDIKTLIDAFNLFWNKYSDVKLYIVGDGDKATEFKSCAKNLKSGKNIIFTGSLDNPYALMKGAIANILSSKFEGFGMVLVESMALNTPMISSNCKSGPSEILEQGKSGILFEVGNSKQLFECMEKVYTQKDTINQMVARASNSLERFEPSKIFKQIADLIYGVVQHG